MISARDDNFNLKLELSAILLVLASLVFVTAASLLTFTIVGLETVDDPEIEKPSPTQVGPYGYVISLLVVLMPAFFLALAALGLRLFFVRFA